MPFDYKQILIAIGCIGLFYAITYCIALFRKKKSLEITFNDIILGILPFAMLLGMFGYVSDISISDVKIAFREAAQQPIKMTLTAIPYTNVDYERKEGRDYLKIIVDNRPQALSFQLGYRQYNVKIMKQYFRELSPYARYVLFFDSEYNLVSMIEMKSLLPLLFPDDPEMDYDRLSTEKLYKILDDSDVRSLLNIQGMVAAKNAVTTQTSKIETLARMDSLKVDFLPVSDTSKANYSQEIRIARKEDVSTSLLLEVSKFITK